MSNDSSYMPSGMPDLAPAAFDTAFIIDQDQDIYQAIHFAPLQQLPLIQGHNALAPNFNQEDTNSVLNAISAKNNWINDGWLDSAIIPDSHLQLGQSAYCSSLANIAAPPHFPQASAHGVTIQNQSSRVQCTTCSRKPTFGSIKDLERHWKTSSAHFGEGTQFYRCRCGQQTARKDNHKRHIENCSGSSRMYATANAKKSD
ncbi:hypothetical protein BJ166DRAFT_604723 [Pestalotiopsis sp. NC0098]|nr:hypothetical protein BJ166DRAFT_604723 [Pestalotiopsis sp. NC0098]